VKLRRSRSKAALGGLSFSPVQHQRETDRAVALEEILGRFMITAPLRSGARQITPVGNAHHRN
jgi:hypothetical protein